MANSSAQNRKIILIHGLQMLLFGLLINSELTIIGFLVFVPFFWLLITKKKNSFIADLAAGLKNWFGQAIQFILSASEYKPFTWSKI